jgi:hypothetical protein
MFVYQGRNKGCLDCYLDASVDENTYLWVTAIISGVYRMKDAQANFSRGGKCRYLAPNLRCPGYTMAASDNSNVTHGSPSFRFIFLLNTALDIFHLDPFIHGI